MSLCPNPPSHGSFSTLPGAPSHRALHRLRHMARPLRREKCQAGREEAEECSSHYTGAGMRCRCLGKVPVQGRRLMGFRMTSLSPPACDLSNGEPPTGVFKYEMDLKCTAFLALTPGTVLLKLNQSGSWLKATFAQHLIMGNL